MTVNENPKYKEQLNVSTSIANREIKLKCAVCFSEFNLLDDLIEHKEQNATCKNKIRMQSQSELSVFKKSRRKKNMHRHHKLALLFPNELKPKRNKHLLTNKFPSNCSSSKEKTVITSSYYRDEDLEDSDNQEQHHFVSQLEKYRHKTRRELLIRNANKKYNLNEKVAEEKLPNNEILILSENEETTSNADSENNDSKYRSSDKSEKRNLDKVAEENSEDESKMQTSTKKRSVNGKQKTGITHNLTCERKRFTCKYFVEF